METKKTTMLGAVLAVAIIAFAGVGYAAVTGYEATTTNTNNAMDSVYVDLTQTSGATYSENFLTGVKFNSTNVENPNADDDPTTDDASITTYKIVYTGVYDSNATATTPTTTPMYTESGEGTKNAARISDDLSLQIAPSGGDATSGKLYVTVDNFQPQTDDFNYIMILTGNNFQKACVYNSGWEFDGVTFAQDSTATYSVTLLIQMKSDTASTFETGFAHSGAQASAKNTFTFRLVV